MDNASSENPSLLKKLASELPFEERISFYEKLTAINEYYEKFSSEPDGFQDNPAQSAVKKCLEKFELFNNGKSDCGEITDMRSLESCISALAGEFANVLCVAEFHKSCPDASVFDGEETRKLYNMLIASEKNSDYAIAAHFCRTLLEKSGRIPAAASPISGITAVAPAAEKIETAEAEICLPAEIVCGNGKLNISGTIVTGIEDKTITALTIPYGITAIGEEAFSECDELVSVNFPETVTGIGEKAFFKCRELREINFPASLKFIGEAAFAGCTGLDDINLPEGLLMIDDFAFCQIRGKKTIFIPSTVNQIGAAAFSTCDALVLSPQNTSFRMDPAGGLVDINNHRLLFFPPEKGGSYTIPGDVKIVDTRCFFMSKLQNITIPTGVEKLGYMSFSYCQEIEHISLPDSVTEIGTSAFSYCENLKSVKLPAGLTEIPHGCFTCSGLTGIRIPESVREIGRLAFVFCSDLNNISMSEKTCFYADAFAGSKFGKSGMIPFFHISELSTELSPDGTSSDSIKGGGEFDCFQKLCIADIRSTRRKGNVAGAIKTFFYILLMILIFAAGVGVILLSKSL